ncbi:signal peptidase II, partial [Micromonospora sp. DH15]|nr:signal peptidase II [Micromonospora sp. DH15]
MTATPPAGTETGTAEPGGGRARRRAIVLLAGVGLFAFLADLLTKHLALQALSDREPVKLRGGAVYLSLTRN